MPIERYSEWEAVKAHTSKQALNITPEFQAERHIE